MKQCTWITTRSSIVFDWFTRQWANVVKYTQKQQWMNHIVSIRASVRNSFHQPLVWAHPSLHFETGCACGVHVTGWSSYQLGDLFCLHSFEIHIILICFRLYLVMLPCRRCGLGLILVLAQESIPNIRWCCYWSRGLIFTGATKPIDLPNTVVSVCSTCSSGEFLVQIPTFRSSPKVILPSLTLNTVSHCTLTVCQQFIEIHLSVKMGP